MAFATEVREYIRITPTGHLRPATDWTQAGATEPAAAASSSTLRRAFEAFQTEAPAGLFELAAHPISGGLPPQLAYWRDFAARYLSERCHTP